MRFASYCIGAGFYLCAPIKGSGCGFPLSSKKKVQASIVLQRLSFILSFEQVVNKDWLVKCYLWTDLHNRDYKTSLLRTPSMCSYMDAVQGSHKWNYKVLGIRKLVSPFRVAQWFGLGTSMLEVSSSKPLARESKGFAFWVEQAWCGLLLLCDLRAIA